MYHFPDLSLLRWCKSLNNYTRTHKGLYLEGPFPQPPLLWHGTDSSHSVYVGDGAWTCCYVSLPLRVCERETLSETLAFIPSIAV